MSILEDKIKIKNKGKNKNKWRDLNRNQKVLFAIDAANSTAKDIQRAVRVLQDTILRVHLQSKNTLVPTQGIDRWT